MSQIWWIWYKELQENFRRLAVLVAGAACISLAVAIRQQVDTGRAFMNYSSLLTPDASEQLSAISGIALFFVNVVYGFSLLFWFGILILALNHLAYGLNSDRITGSHLFYKTLPVSDGIYSAAKYLLYGWGYPLIATVIIGGCCVMAGSLLVLTTEVDRSLILLSMARVTLLPFQVGFGPGNQEVNAILYMNFFECYLVAGGVCYLFGSIFRQRAFLYTLLLTLGLTIGFNMLLNGSAATLQSVRWMAGLPKSLLWARSIIGNGLCVIAATLIYARKEG